MYKTVNQIFKEKIDFLKIDKGVSYSAIARKIGIRGDRMKSIRLNRSSATVKMLEALDNAYPEVFKQEEQTNPSNEIAKLREEIARLKQELSKVNNVQTLILDKLNTISMAKERDEERLKRLEEETKKRVDEQIEKLKEIGMGD